MLPYNVYIRLYAFEFDENRKEERISSITEQKTQQQCETMQKVGENGEMK